MIQRQLKCQRYSVAVSEHGNNSQRHPIRRYIEQGNAYKREEINPSRGVRECQIFTILSERSR